MAGPTPSPRWLVRRALLGLKGRLLLGGAAMYGPLRPEIAVTFDDGPTSAYTPQILDILSAHRARATFFVLGMHVEREPDLARRVAAEHEVGCHSYSHARETVRTLDAFRADVARCKDVMQRELGVVPRHYRFPWGDPGAIAPADVMRLEGMTCVHWSGSGEERFDADRIARSLGHLIEPGAILLLHDGLAPGSLYPRPRDQTVAALPRVLDAIAARGLRPVTLRELLEH